MLRPNALATTVRLAHLGAVVERCSFRGAHRQRCPTARAKAEGPDVTAPRQRVLAQRFMLRLQQHEREHTAIARFVIHIGPHKTGSTYLQRCLRENADALQAAGIVLPRPWEDSPLKPSHTGLVHRLVTERRAELEPVFAAWRPAKTVVISCEDLSAMSLEPIKVLMLREVIGDAPVRIVFYARRWSELLSSEWKEYVKQGSRLSFLEVLAHNLRNPVKSRIVNIDACLSVYRDLFGIDSISVIAYDEVLTSGADVFDHFAGAYLGSAAIGAHTSKLVNRSLTAAQTELMRLFNVLGSEAGIDSSRLLRFFYLQHAPAPLLDAVVHLESFQTSIELSDDDPCVREVLNNNRRQYAPCAVAPVAKGSFYEPKIVQATFIRPEYALSPGFAEAVRGLWAALLEVEKPR